MRIFRAVVAVLAPVEMALTEVHPVAVMVESVLQVLSQLVQMFFMVAAVVVVSE
jgi:hypothetical protein